MAERHRAMALTWEEQYDADPPSLAWVAVPVLAAAAIESMATCRRVPKKAATAVLATIIRSMGLCGCDGENEEAAGGWEPRLAA